MPKIDTPNALGDAITQSWPPTLTINFDYLPWPPILTTNLDYQNGAHVMPKTYPRYAQLPTVTVGLRYAEDMTGRLSNMNPREKDSLLLFTASDLFSSTSILPSFPSSCGKSDAVLAAIYVILERRNYCYYLPFSIYALLFLSLGGNPLLLHNEDSCHTSWWP